MRIRVLSDLHVSHEHNAWRNVPDVDCDVTVILGDVANPMTSGMEWVARTFSRPLIYVCGNHCFYRGLQGSGEEHTFYQQQKERGREMAERFGITFLDNEVATIEDVRFLGATLWSDFSILPPMRCRRAKRDGAQPEVVFGTTRTIMTSAKSDSEGVRTGIASRRRKCSPFTERAAHSWSASSRRLSLDRRFA
jgi:Calcineurin-like phosphoesterase superfamily domain